MVYWIWLTKVVGVGVISQRILLGKFKEPINIYNASLQELETCEGVRRDIIRKVFEAKSLEIAKKIYDETVKLKIKLLTLNDPLYPEKAKVILDMPILLYYKGQIINDCMGVAIVGSRRSSEYGKEVTKGAASYLANNGVSVISGMAKGIDSYAHTVCLKENGYTIAILGSGVDICYPSEHKKLMNEIIINGAILSEYPPGTKADKMHFPRRNRIIAAWSHKILVVEATIKSGTLITADFAKEYNRDLLAVPNNIYTKDSMGTNELILNGAKVYLKEEQLLIKSKNNQEDKKIIGEKNNKTQQIKLGLGDLELRIFDIIKKEKELTIAELSIRLNISQMIIYETVSMLELMDIIAVNGVRIQSKNRACQE